MPLVPPSLDDRAYDDLVKDVLARIPAHAPEYAHPVPGDPGRTLIELFAWLTDTLLYRANLVPERQRLVFLSLLGLPLRPAGAATGLVSVRTAQPTTLPFRLDAGAAVSGAQAFESREPVIVLPVEGRAFIKKPVTPGTGGISQDLVEDLVALYGLQGRNARPYATTQRFAGRAERVDLVQDTLDRSLWIALLAPDAASVAPIRAQLETGLTVDGRDIPLALSVGLVPSETIPDTFDARFLATMGERRGAQLVWEIGVRNESDGTVVLQRVVPSQDTTRGLSTRGVVQLPLPRGVVLDAPTNDVRVKVDAGVGDLAPRIDDPKLASRLVSWVRLQVAADVATLGVDWAGINAVPVEHRRTVTGRIVGTSNGAADQILSLGAGQVDVASLVVEVEEEGLGFRAWVVTDALEAAGRDDGAVQIDAEGGLIRFGDGVRGRIPARGARIKTSFRAGGGAAGNLAPGSLKDATGTTTPQYTGKLAVTQAVETQGGVDAETLAEAERRIPAHLTHRDRAVTTDDFAALARTTPGVDIGRVELLPQFKPHTRDTDVPGVVSVLVLPRQQSLLAPYPRPDRRLIEAVHAWLDARRVIGTELYVIGTQYKPVGVAVRVEVREGYDEDVTLRAVADAVRTFLFPLAPGGPYQPATGWPLGRPVRDREIEVVVARVPGVDEVIGLRLFEVVSGAWRRVRPASGDAAQIPLDLWALPELVGLDVGTTSPLPTTLAAAPETDPTPSIGIPVVPEVC
jgi:predicted phage baseplate assembly protein